MDENLHQIKLEVYDKCVLELSGIVYETESHEYKACKFKLNGKNVLSRSAKITPKKVGQFVTFWKRNEEGVIEPFQQNDEIDFYIINVRSESCFGQFVFPKSVLLKQKIMSTEKGDGKRGFRVYPRWDITNNRQAECTQKWQLNYFYQIDDSTDLVKVKELYKVS